MRLSMLCAIALCACGAPSTDTPPESIEVDGPLVGVFYSITTVTDERVDTSLVMSVSEVREGCESIALDTAMVTIDDASSLPMEQQNEDGAYVTFHREPAAEFEMVAVRGDDQIRATLSPPEVFSVTIADGAVRWSPSGEPDTAVYLWFAGPGTAISRLTEDTGEYVPAPDDLDQSGEWTVSVEKRRTTDTWCVEYDAPGDSKTCCAGWWTSLVRRDATGSFE